MVDGALSRRGFVLFVWMSAVDDNHPALRSNSSSSGISEFIIANAEGSEVNRRKERKRERERIYGPSMATQTTASCTGSTLLQPISEIINLPVDQVRFKKKKIRIRDPSRCILHFYTAHPL